MEGLGVAIGSRRDVSTEEIVSMARLADRLGYASVWVGESWGRDAFTLLTMIACHTTNVRLGTGIVPVYSRTPALLAQTAASLDAISNGRAILGLGTSGRLVIEQWHGEKFDRPLLRTREYIEIIRMALAGERVNYDGRYYQVQRFRMATEPVQERLPIYVASLGPKNLELTGQLADGWLPTWVDVLRLPEMREQVVRPAVAAGDKRRTLQWPRKCWLLLRPPRKRTPTPATWPGRTWPTTWEAWGRTTSTSSDATATWRSRPACARRGRRATATGQRVPSVMRCWTI